MISANSVVADAGKRITLDECLEGLMNTVTLDGAHKSSLQFVALCCRMIRMHLEKSADYGSKKDPLANIRACEELGISAFQGTAIRMFDKVARIKAFMVNKSLKNESIVDSLLDLACYSLIAAIVVTREDGKDCQ